MLILGVDPGLNTTGYGLLKVTAQGPQVIEAGVVRGGPAEDDLAVRLQEIHNGLNEVIKQHQPDVMALEQLYSHIEHPRTSIMMGHARGVIVLSAALAKIPVLHYSATQIKKTLTGNGRAPKQQMQLAITRELGLTQVPEPADVADALAIALCHYYTVRITSLTPPSRKARPA